MTPDLTPHIPNILYRWALGIFLYEMLRGRTPFKGEALDDIQVYKNIVNPGFAVHYPPSLSAQVWATLPPPLHPLRLTPTRV